MREDVKTALLNMYSRIDEARARQVATGSVDQGNRQGITSGQHMAGLIDLIRNDLISAGIGENEIFSSRANVTLPGWYRATKDWDMLAFCDEKLLALLPIEKRADLLAVLAEDPRPAYQEDPERVYGFLFAGFEVKFSVKETMLTVLDIIPKG